MARMAFSGLRGAFRPDGSLMRLEEWDDATAAHIGSIEVVTRNVGEGQSDHDDLVLAAAIAVWGAEHRPQPIPFLRIDWMSR